MNIVQPIRNREDIEKMKAVLKRKKRDLVLFIFGINCGLRISDILKLNVGDVKGRDFVEIKEKMAKVSPIRQACIDTYGMVTPHTIALVRGLA
jgi:integrase